MLHTDKHYWAVRYEKKILAKKGPYRPVHLGWGLNLLSAFSKRKGPRIDLGPYKPRRKGSPALIFGGKRYYGVGCERAWET